MKTLIYSIIALSIISFYACSNSSGGGTVAPEEELYPELAGKWYKHDIESDPRNIEYWQLSSKSNQLTVGILNHYFYNGQYVDSLLHNDVYNGTWEGKTFRGVYYRTAGNRQVGMFMQVTFTGTTMRGFWVDSFWVGSYPHVEFDGYKM